MRFPGEDEFGFFVGGFFGFEWIVGCGAREVDGLDSRRYCVKGWSWENGKGILFTSSPKSAASPASAPPLSSESLTFFRTSFQERKVRRRETLALS